VVNLYVFINSPKRCQKWNSINIYRFLGWLLDALKINRDFMYFDV
jgi:hypothetical protein